ncbi:MAG: hypothetical protein J6K33_03090 [Alistipes sp.]|nr:hypothetical protein [Alistipes sp.]
MNIVQLNTVNLGGDIVVKKSEGGSSGGGKYYLIDGQKMIDAVGVIAGVTDTLDKRSATFTLLEMIARSTAYILYVYRGTLRSMPGLLDAGDTPSEDFRQTELTGVKFEQGDSDTKSYEEEWSIFGVDPTSFLTPCTKEEFYALTTE